MEHSLPLVKRGPIILGLSVSFTPTGLAVIIFQTPSKAIKAVKVVNPYAPAPRWRTQGK